MVKLGGISVFVWEELDFFEEVGVECDIRVFVWGVGWMVGGIKKWKFVSWVRVKWRFG